MNDVRGTERMEGEKQQKHTFGCVEEVDLSNVALCKQRN